MPTVPTGTVAHTFSTRAVPNNVTVGNSRVGWVSASSGRSTSDILWSCFSILLVCTWRCIHFNIPSIDESEARWHSWGIFIWPGTRLWSKWAYRVGWMFGIILAPEFGVAIAMSQHLEAREGLQQLRVGGRTGIGSQNGESKNVESKEIRSIDPRSTDDQVKVLGVGRDEITKAHIFFANMGGFIAKVCVLPRPQQPSTALDEPDGVSAIPKTSQEILYTISSYAGLEILLERFPDLRLPSEKDIEDLSKADSFTKAFACLQSGWLVVQSIARVSQGLPITELELATMAFVVCALMMYMLWWDKPFGVDRRLVLTVVTYESVDAASMPLEPVRRYDHQLDSTWDELLGIYGGAIDFTIPKLKDIVYGFGGLLKQLFGRSNLTYPPKDETISVSFYAAGTIFSSFHIGAWNWDFPSPVVRTLWRTFAIVATGTGPTAIFLFLVYDVIIRPKEETKFRDKLDQIAVLTLLFLALVYVISRLALIILIFYCFSSMPAGVYETVDWTQFLPHFS